MVTVGMNTVKEPLTAAVSPPPSLRDSEAEDHSRNSTSPDAAPHDAPRDEPHGALDAHRCQFTFADGRQCRMPRAAYHSSLCADHAYKEDGGAPSALPELETLCNDLTTSTNINRALAQTCRLLAQGRISQRQAVAFGYLHQLLLQTVAGVRAEYVAAYGYKPWEARLKESFEPPRNDDPAPPPNPPPNYQSILTRARDISDGKYNTTPEGRAEMKRFTYELEMMKPPSSKPPKGFVGDLVQFARSVQAGLAPAPPPLALNNLGHPIKPAVCGDPTRIAVPSEQRERGNRVHGKPGEQAISSEPSSPATAPPEPRPAFDPNTFAPNYMAKRSSVPVKRPEFFGAEDSAPAPDPAGSAPPKPDDRVGHTTDWFAPAGWTKPLPDPFPSREKRLQRDFRGASNCRSRRLRH